MKYKNKKEYKNYRFCVGTVNRNEDYVAVCAVLKRTFLKYNDTITTYLYKIVKSTII